MRPSARLVPQPLARARMLGALALASASSLITSCAATRTPGPEWWGEKMQLDGETHHVITGGLALERFKAAPRVRVSIPSDWRSAPREMIDGELTARLKTVKVEEVDDEARTVEPWKGPIIVERSAALVERRPLGERDVAPADGAIYLVRESQEAEHLHVDVIGYDGWPPQPVRVASFDWTVKEEEIRGWQEDPFMRGPAQLLMMGVGIGLVAWVAEGGLGDLQEWNQ